MVHYASADQIARAVIASARLTGADPLDVVGREPIACNRMTPGGRAQMLAFASLVQALPGARVSAIGRGLGFRRRASVVMQKLSPLPRWMRADWLDEVIGAVRAPEIAPAVAPEESAPEEQLPAAADWLRAPAAAPAHQVESLHAKAVDFLNIPPAAPARRCETLPQHDRKPARRMRHALPMGEPEPGRSALDQRRAGIVEEDLPEGRWNKKVSLPSLSFLSKGF